MIEPLSLTLAQHAAYQQWAVLGILVLIGASFAIFNVILSSLVGPSRKGATKDSPYESGVDPVGNPRQRFNVRFYLVAMIFLVFDVEVLFFIPWVTLFPNYKFLQSFGLDPAVTPVTLFLSVITFTAIVLLAYVYAWAKGVFKWD